jgi:fructosamine-3-kinase
MYNEKKYIIVKDKISNRLKHFKSEFLHHSTIARDNGYNSSDIIEAGLFLDKTFYILESINLKHILKHKSHYIGNRLNEYHDLRLENWLKSRELESQLYYSKKAIKTLPEGD